MLTESTDENNMYHYVQGKCSITCIVTGDHWQQNTYIVTHLPSANTIIIDPGNGADLIIDLTRAEGAKVTRILLTHPHHDHVGAAAQLSGYFNVACELHSQDVRLLMHAPMYALRFANTKISPISNFQQFDQLPICNDDPIVWALHTPGHTKGSVCYFFNGFVFTGDTLLFNHIGRTDLPGGCSDEISLSVTNLLDQLSDEITIFPGHGKPWDANKAKKWWKEQSIPPEHNAFTDDLG